MHVHVMRDKREQQNDPVVVHRAGFDICDRLDGLTVLCLEDIKRETPERHTLRALEEGLDDFAGCAVVVSHDRWFLDRICTHILSFEGDGEVVYYEGSYSDYEEFKKAHNGGKELPRRRYRKLME